MFLKRFIILKIFPAVMDDARNILLNLVNLTQTVLFRYNSKDRSWEFRLNHLLIFSILVLCNSLIGQLNFDYKNFSIFMKQRHPVFINNRIFLLLIVSKVHLENLFLDQIVHNPYWNVCIISFGSFFVDFECNVRNHENCVCGKAGR